MAEQVGELEPVGQEPCGITPAVGTDTEYARQDHTHGSPTEAAIVALVPAGLLTVDAGTTTYSAAGSDVTVTYSTVWGYDADGPYYDSAGAVDGEQAILALDPSTGELAAIPMLP